MNKMMSIVTLTFLLTVFACNSDKSFQQTESGLTYKFHERNKGENPSIDNIVEIQLAYRTAADSMFFNSVRDGGGMPMFINIQPSEYEGDIYEAFRMMSEGDSATFLMDAAQFFTTTLKSPSVPPFMNEGDSLYIDVLMENFYNEEEFAEYQEQQREEQMKEQEELAEAETGLLDQYLDENNIDAEPEESGLIIIVEEQGQGPKPVAGQKVKVHYTGRVLDGTEFDSSEARGPFEFTLGQGQVIRGWDEGVANLNVGSKAQLIIPSHLAYGNQERGPVIKPYSTLVFDIEVLEIVE